MPKEKSFREIMERHKRVDSWLVAALLSVLFFYSLWLHNVSLSLTFFITVFILPFIFSKPKRKIKFINEFIEWEIAWCKLPPYSKLIDWIIEAVGFIVVVYGTWQHNWFLIFVGILILVIGMMDFLIRFGYRRAFEGGSEKS